MRVDIARVLAVAVLLASFGSPRLLAQADSGAATDGMTVTEFGVGTGVKDRKLIGKRESFRAGHRVWFWTRVRGGAPGDRVRHVWLREGEEVFSIGLSIGGDRWRTYSNKVLPASGAGRWAVEVRTADDRVLARQEFVCTSAN